MGIMIMTTMIITILTAEDNIGIQDADHITVIDHLHINKIHNYHLSFFKKYLSQPIQPIVQSIPRQPTTPLNIPFSARHLMQP